MAQPNSTLSLVEKQLLLGQTVNRPEDGASQLQLAALLSEGSYEDVLGSAAASAIFGTSASEADVADSDGPSPFDPSFEPKDLPLYLTASVRKYTCEHGADSWRTISWIGAACLNAFVQTNWTGPEFLLDPAGRVYLGAKQSEERGKLDRFLLETMQVDGEEAYTLTPRPLYLYLARLLLVDIPVDDLLSERDSVAPSAHWWAARVLLIQQGLLEYPTQTLLDQVLDHYRITKQHLPNVAASDRDIWARYSIEVGVAYSQHQMNIDSKKHFFDSQAASGLQWEITGAKGKRTRFQGFDVAQLVLLAKSANRTAAGQGHQAAIPEAMELNDDTLLETIQFTDTDIDPTRQEQLHVLDECILLAFCLNVQNENPAHGLTSEQMMPFVTRVLQHPGNWSVYTMALLLRSRLEATKTRTVERSTLQLQALVDQISHPLPGSEEAGAAERMQHFYAISLPSQWELERELAKQFMSLGVVRSALDIFERLHMWDEVISCYQLLGQEEVAERIIREQLELFPERPKLWCILGDLKQEPEHWLKAWEVSGRRYARAMRALGAYHYAHKDYEKAVEYYQLALKLNPLFDRSWYILGCAAINTKNWKVAAEAFQRVVNIDSENGEAWNNLASIYMRSGDGKKDRAWYALREALKSKFDSWQIWSNFLVISASLGQMSSAIHAMSRIVELRAEKDGAACIDLEILRMIISSVTRGQITNGLSTEEAKRKEKQLSRYIEHLLVNVIESRITNSAPLWRAMADFWFWRGDYLHCLDCYIKAYRCLSQMPEVTYAPPVFNDAVEAALELVSMYENLGSKTQMVRRKAAAVSQVVCEDWKHQSKMLLRGLIGKGKESFEGTPNYERLAEALRDLRQA
ncbi:TPR-like protein [Martensiomyces pterosporus]|nr:TPR-like protein [Martensiomyces pterosporus]